MPGSKSNLHEDVINDTSDLSEMKLSDKKGSAEKRRMALIEKNGYHDSVYLHAAKIFQGIHTEKRKDRILVRYGDDSVAPMLTFKDGYSQRASYELAFNALKYQDLLEEILLDSCVYPCQSIPDDSTSLLVVMLYDLQDRKFQAREIFDEEEPVAEVRKIEHYLHSFRTKLAAALARYRIKHGALSVEYLLPETVRKQEERASALPLCAWVNTFKISLQDVFRDLQKAAFTKVESVSDFKQYTYCMDQHCHDVLLFPSSLKEELLNLDLFADCKLVLQDKSRSLAAHAAQALLDADGDVLVAQAGSHLTVAHMSALTLHSTSRIFVCGVTSSAKAAELRDLFNRMGCKNIQLLYEDFNEIGPTDPRLEKAKVILLIPQCSGLGVGNPIDFILNEHGDAGLLRDIFQGSVPEDKLSILAERQLKELMHAMKFNNIQAIVYCTCSIYPEENELVVKKALESGVEGNKVRPYRLIPPVFSTSSNSEDSTDLFFKMEPSEISSGCFLAILAKKKDSSQNVSVKDILARAAAKGLLGNVVEKSKEEEKKQKVTQRRRNVTDRGIEPKTAGIAGHGMEPKTAGIAGHGMEPKTAGIGGHGIEPKTAGIAGHGMEPKTAGIGGHGIEPKTAGIAGHGIEPKTAGIAGHGIEPKTAGIAGHGIEAKTAGIAGHGIEPKTAGIAGHGIEAKTAAFLHHSTVSSIQAEVSTSKVVSNVQQKSVSRTNVCVQLKKSVNPISNVALPKVLKHTPPSSPTGKAHGRQTVARKAHAERKRLVLKTVEIVFPPVVMPYVNLQGNNPRASSHLCSHGWTGVKGSSGRTPAPSPSKVVKPTVFSHPRP